jgi:Flp pilus assembly protein TadG
MNSDQREVVVISFMLLSPILMALMLTLINTFSS